MNQEEAGYRDWPSLSKAIKSAAQKAVSQGLASDLNASITQARFDRFLSRVFAQGEDSEWLLKGGTSILARVPRSRATRDVDLAASGAQDLDQAVAALQQAVSTDLGDHVRFELSGSRQTGLGDNQPGVQTRRVVFTCLDTTTGRKIGDVPVDIVVGPAPVGRPETLTPANRLDLPRPVVSHPYRLFPVADQVAEKVCATMATNYPGGKPSSRVKDLVDLVVIARTQNVDLDELRAAIATKRRLSRLPPFDRFATPPGWERQYRALAGGTLPTGGITDIAQAQDLVAQLIDPALTTRAGSDPMTWIPGYGWLTPTDASEAIDSGPGDDGHGIEPVRSHTRAGRPVRSYHRNPRSS